MTNILHTATTWLGSRLQNHAGVSITYYRGQQSVDLTATVALHEYDVVDSDGFGITMLSRDYIVHAAALLISGEEIAPKPGDRIVETIRETQHTYEVMPLGVMKEYEPMDTNGTLLRIHTKRIA